MAYHAEMRRGLKALNSVFGNKIAILAGDFLLARASVSLAALRDSEVIQLLSQVIEDLVTGEILQVCTHPSSCCATHSAQDLASMRFLVTSPDLCYLRIKAFLGLPIGLLLHLHA